MKMKKNKLPLKHPIILFFLAIISLWACETEQVTLSPVKQSISESVYASGIIVSNNQYQVYATVSGIVNEVFAEQGSDVEIGSPILSIANEAQQLMVDNAKLTLEINDLNYNKGKIDEANLYIDLMKSQLENDSSMLARQQSLWAQNIGSKVELEQRELALKRSQNNLVSAKEKLKELKKQIDYLSKQSQNNLSINKKNTGDYLLKSKVKGKVFQMNIAKGEIVTPQIPIGIIGDDKKYILEMQIDEYDIVTIQLGMPVFVVLNSYKDSVFNAVVTKINPIMNLQSKTFTIEAEFTVPPKVLYPNISFEANVLINTKKDAILIPRNYLLKDSIVVNKEGKEIIVKTGLKDYQMVEILSGITINEELILPDS